MVAASAASRATQQVQDSDGRSRREEVPLWPLVGDGGAMSADVGMDSARGKREGDFVSLVEARLKCSATRSGMA